MKKYIRTEDGIYEINWFDTDNFGDEKGDIHSNCEIIDEADTIEELIQIGDIVFYWSPSDDKEHCVLITCDTEICAIRGSVITKLLLPMKEYYKCVAKSYSSFNLIRDRKYLVSKGELELL